MEQKDSISRYKYLLSSLYAQGLDAWMSLIIYEQSLFPTLAFHSYHPLKNGITESH